MPAAKTTEGAGGEKQVVYYYTYSVEQVEVSEYESDIAHDDPVSNGVKSFSWKITYRHNFELPLSGRWSDWWFIAAGMTALLLGMAGAGKRRRFRRN